MPIALEARDGGVLTLGDGSRWEVHGGSRPELVSWRTGDQLMIHENPVGPVGFTWLIQNTTSRSQAQARPLK